MFHRQKKRITAKTIKLILGPLSVARGQEIRAEDPLMFFSYKERAFF